MKKKGLIISTIVMVVVLVASLTTATYAWFTTSSVTEISGFELNVVSSNVLNIGLKANSTYAAAPETNMFVSGTCTYANGTGGAGFLDGSWSGEFGQLSPSVDHQIYFGDVTAAVGIAETDSYQTAQTAGIFGPSLSPGASNALVAGVAAGDGSLSLQRNAVVNGSSATGAEVAGDLAYLFLGAQPTTTLATDTNKLYIVVRSIGAGTTVGIASAIHVAYRLNSNGVWTDVDVYGGVHYNATRSACDIKADASSLGSGVSYVAGTNTSTIQSARALEIDLAGVDAASVIDQIELVIYLAGEDTDCIDAAKGVSVSIGIFFGAQAAVDNN